MTPRAKRAALSVGVLILLGEDRGQSQTAPPPRQPFLNINPSWSPDGETIVFDSSRDGVWNLYSIRPDGTGEKRLTYPDTARGPAFARHPRWSPDGRQIAFDSDRDGDEEIYRIERDGSGLVRLTTGWEGVR